MDVASVFRCSFQVRSKSQLQYMFGSRATSSWLRPGGKWQVWMRFGVVSGVTKVERGSQKATNDTMTKRL